MGLALRNPMHAQNIWSWWSLSSTPARRLQGLLCAQSWLPQSVLSGPCECDQHTVPVKIQCVLCHCPILTPRLGLNLVSLSLFPLILFTLATIIRRFFTLGASKLEPVELPAVLAEELRVCCVLLGWTCALAGLLWVVGVKLSGKHRSDTCW